MSNHKSSILKSLRYKQIEEINELEDYLLKQSNLSGYLAWFVNTYINDLTIKLNKLNYKVSDLDLLLQSSLDKSESLGSSLLETRYLALLDETYESAFNLGLIHTLEDWAFNYDIYSDYFDEIHNLYKKKATKNNPINLFDSSTLANMIETDLEKAEFAKKKKDKNKRIRAAQIGRAARSKKTLDNLISRFLNNIKETGILNRYPIEQRYIFLDMISELNNMYRKGEVSKSTFLADNYLASRKKILTGKYSSSVNKKIKQLIAEYVSTNRESINTILNTRKLDHLRYRISGLIAPYISEMEEGDNMGSYGDKIIRTELSIVYNFGKIAAFNSPEDMNREFQWNADREMLALRLGNEVKTIKRTNASRKKGVDSSFNRNKRVGTCDYCFKLHVSKYKVTVAELIEYGYLLDIGVKGRNKKAIVKNTFQFDSHKPFIPAHPCCACFWTLVPTDLEEKQSKAKAAILGTALSAGAFIGTQFLQNNPDINLLNFIKQSQQEQQNLVNKNILSLPPKVEKDISTSTERSKENLLRAGQLVLGTGMIVAGSFLLSRSNMWKTFSKSFIKQIPNTIKIAKNLPETKIIAKSTKPIEPFVKPSKTVTNLTNNLKQSSEELVNNIFNRPTKIPAILESLTDKELDELLLEITKNNKIIS